jgi:hypothetical protein
VAILWAVTNGHLDDVPTNRVREFETGLYRFLESAYEGLLPAIAKEKALSDELVEQLKKAVAEFKQQGGFGESKTDAAEGGGKADAVKADDVKPKGAKPKDAKPKGAKPKGAKQEPAA